MEENIKLGIKREKFSFVVSFYEVYRMFIRSDRNLVSFCVVIFEKERGLK